MSTPSSSGMLCSLNVMCIILSCRLPAGLSGAARARFPRVRNFSEGSGDIQDRALAGPTMERQIPSRQTERRTVTMRLAEECFFVGLSWCYTKYTVYS